MSQGRCSGLLLHITSLPSPWGVGDLGPEARRFADFLSGAGQRLWQVLPLNPTERAHGDSPYHSPSVFAANDLLVSPELLVEEGFLAANDLPDPPPPSGRTADYHQAGTLKDEIIRRAWQRLESDGPRRREFEEFVAEQRGWLEDYSLFTALHDHFGGASWQSWPEELRDRRPEVMGRMRDELRDAVDLTAFGQYLFHRQWRALRRHCRDRGILLFGDLPIYPTYDSAEVWANPAVFKLDENRLPSFAAGVPPDYFSATGQLWGNPVYDWSYLRQSGFSWWIERIRRNLSLYDLVRIDHFRGLVACWEVPAGHRTAINGRWAPAPAFEFFEHLSREMDISALVAEDLGTITPDVTEVRRHFRIPGMLVLLFAFGGGSDNPYLPHNHERNAFVYTGTHDNNTSRGWFDSEASAKEKEGLFRYLGRELAATEVSEALIRTALASVADRSVIPVQDLLGLGARHRMNTPSVGRGNWVWRLLPGELTAEKGEKLLNLCSIYGRIPDGPP